MTDGKLLAAIKQIRDVCDGLAGTIAGHSDAHGLDHPASNCAEAVSRVVAGFVAITDVASATADVLCLDLADAVRDMINELNDKEDPP